MIWLIPFTCYSSGQYRETSSVVKGNDDAFDPPLCIFSWLYLSFFKFRFAKKLENKQKIGFLIQQPIENINILLLFIGFQLKTLIVLNTFVGERSLEPPPYLVANDLNKKLEDVFIVLKLIFSSQRNSFSVIDLLISNLLLHANSFVRPSED